VKLPPSEWDYTLNVGSFFGALYLCSTRPFLDETTTHREADFIVEALKLRPDERVLDLCCGHGRHLVWLRKHSPNTWGLDLDETSLEIARESLRADADRRLVRGNLYALPFHHAFDALYAWYASLFLSEDDAVNQEALTQAARALKPGGRMLIHSHNPERQAKEAETRLETTLPDGSHLLEVAWYDPVNGLLHGERRLEGPDGTLEGHYQVRCPSLVDYRKWCRSSGLVLEQAWGDIAGRPPSAEAVDLIVRLRRP
jgi:SAM-dependent methyltransferase